MHLYVHVPFCARRCSYCDFAIAVRREVPSDEFASAIEAEWASRQAVAVWSESPGLDTVYFGGGTPSRLDPSAIARLVARFASLQPLREGAEVTLEANPDDVSDARAAAWLSAGVNRISLGVQTFHPGALAWMHRTHDAQQVVTAMGALRRAGFRNISLDLIYALPDVLERSWAEDLDRALTLEPTHLSLYGLTVESHTPLGKWTARGESLPADDDRAAGEYLAAHAALSAAGFEHYEVSNAALPGFRARHNAAYWRRAPFLGLGPSAHSGWGAERSWNVREWEAYRRLASQGNPVLAEVEQLTPGQIRLEERYLALRTDAGIPSDRIPGDARTRWVATGWARETGKRTVLTPEGWLRLDALVSSLSDC